MPAKEKEKAGGKKKKKKVVKVGPFVPASIELSTVHDPELVKEHGKSSPATEKRHTYHLKLKDAGHEVKIELNESNLRLFKAAHGKLSALLPSL